MNPGKPGRREKNLNRPLAYRNALNFDANHKDDKLLVLRKTSEIWPISESQRKTEGKKHKTNTKHPKTMNEPTTSPTPETSGPTKRCSHCGQIKPLTEFHANKQTADGHHHQCRECRKERNRASALKRRLGLAPDLKERNPLFEGVTDRDLFAELRARGYRGSLTIEKSVNI